MTYSPLRYPGGKAKLYPFFSELIKDNNLFGDEYCEPYAGGAGLAIRLLVNGFVERISINDIDRSIYAFWNSVFYNTDEFCRMIDSTPVTIDEWYRQRTIWMAGDGADALALGFSAYFLNRTNRSGIIEGAGPIGGYSQSGKWKIDVRLVKNKQIDNIKLLARCRKQIEIHNEDAIYFVKKKMDAKNSFLYLDPPYFVKGSRLYKNFYKPADHALISRELEMRRNDKWIVSYDNVPEIREIYGAFQPIVYNLNYSAGEKTIGSEVIFVSDAITPPTVKGFQKEAA